MTVDLEAIARRGRCEAASLKIALPLLEQGYTPPFLSRYRRDELGSVDERSLWMLSQAVAVEQDVQRRRQELSELWNSTRLVDPSLGRAIEKAGSKRLLDRLARRLKLELNEQVSDSARLAVRTLNPKKGDGNDLAAIADKVEEITDKAAAVQGFDEALATRLCGDPRVIGAAVRWLAKNARIHVSQIHDPHVSQDDSDSTSESETKAATATESNSATADAPAGGETAEQDAASQPPSDSSGGPSESPAVQTPAESPETSVETGAAETQAASGPTNQDSSSPSDSGEQTPAEQTPAEQTSPATAGTASTDSVNESSTAPTASSTSTESVVETNEGQATDPPPANPPAAAADQTAGPKRDAKAAPKKPKKISPRQRRRRWLVSVLKPLEGKRLPTSKLSAFQVVMLGRALRSQVAVCSFEYDAKKLVDEISRSAVGINRSMEAKLRETILIHEANIREAAESAWWDEMQEQASSRLVSIAAENLRSQVNRGGVQAKVVMAIDAVGPRTAAVSIVSSDGRILHNEDIPCQLSKNLRSQAVLKMGELIHAHDIDLIIVSNGPARRACLASIGELIAQSPEKSVRWTVADRNGADAYAGGPVGDQEMKATPRRFRAAAWIAFSILQPAQALAKVDPLKLRLGSFQRELAEDALATALRDVMTSGASRGGVDVNSAPTTWLARLPGMNDDIANAIDQSRRKSLFKSRSQLAELDTWESLVSSRQALPFLRVFDSEVELDGTLIHPDDYALAKKLIKALELKDPPNQPPGYQLPQFDEETESTPSGMPAPSGMVEVKVETPVEQPLQVETFESNDGGDPSFASDLSTEETSSEESPSTEPASDASQGGDASSETSSDPSEATPAVADAESANNESNETSSETETTAESSTDEVSASEPNGEQETEQQATESETPVAASDDNSTSTDASQETYEPFRQALPERSKIDKCVKEWQVGNHRVRQIVHWLCDPFGDSDPSGTEPATLHTMPSLKTLKPGDQVIGVVVGVMPFGVFVELAPDCSGLIHVSRISENYIEDLHEAVQVGDVLTAWVTGTDEKRRRVALSVISPQRAAELDQMRHERPPRGGSRGGHRGQQRGAAGGGQNRGGSEQRGGQSGRGRGAGGQGGGQGQRGGGQGQRTGGQGQRTGGQGQRGRGDSRGGRSGGQRGRQGGRDNRRGGRDRKPEVYRVSGGGPEQAPITDAMKKGDEPLRSFGDLMQFYKDDQPEPPKPSAQATGGQASDQTPPPSSKDSSEGAGTDTPVDSNPPGNDSQDAAVTLPKPSADNVPASTDSPTLQTTAPHPGTDSQANAGEGVPATPEEKEPSSTDAKDTPST